MLAAGMDNPDSLCFHLRTKAWQGLCAAALSHIDSRRSNGRCGKRQGATRGADFIYTGRGAQEFIGRWARGFAFPTVECGVVGHALALQLFTVVKVGKT